MKFKKIPQHIFIISLILGIILRLFSVTWNKYPHFDIFHEVLTASQFFDTYTLTLPHPGYIIDISKNLPNQQPFSDKPPFIVISTAIISKMLNATPYYAAQLISLASGLVSIFILKSILEKISNPKTAYILTSVWTLTYFVIDYSANGSRYMLQTAVLLAIIWIISNKKNLWGLSILSAVMFLNNYQVAFVISGYYAYIFFTGMYSKPKIIFSGIFASILVSPIFIYYYQHFGKIFYTTHYTYVARKSGITNSFEIKWVKPYFIQTQLIPNSVIFLHYFKTKIYLDAIKNCIYTAKQFFEFLPIYPLILFILIKNIKNVWKKIKSDQNLTVILLIFTIYSITIVLYPHVKMRHFLTLYSLLILITAYALTLVKQKTSDIIQYVLLIFTVIMIGITYLRNPFHTFYAGGVVMEDQFRQRAELRTMKSMTLMEEVSKHIPDKGVVATSFDRAYFIPNEVLYMNPFDTLSQQEIIDEYNIKYIWSNKPLSENVLEDNPSVRLIKQIKQEYLYQL